MIEYPGTPVCFGEPSRISCLVQFGDGEVVDVERKNELAGNLHGKGMMISEACLASILELPSQLPFSASLVFEQSYGEIDGDSASLAIFSVLVSALSDLPLPQNIAITGTIDQFGLVHAVGGVNDKIEGFFTICQRRGLTGKQGVVIPATTIQQLSLSDEVVEAVNFNSPGQVVIAGNAAAVERAMTAAKEAGAKTRPAAARFRSLHHCSLMKPAAEKLAEALKDITIKQPQIRVIHNADVASYDDADKIKDALVRQLYSPVRWTETVNALVSEASPNPPNAAPAKSSQASPNASIKKPRAAH